MSTSVSISLLILVGMGVLLWKSNQRGVIAFFFVAGLLFAGTEVGNSLANAIHDAITAGNNAADKVVK